MNQEVGENKRYLVLKLYIIFLIEENDYSNNSDDERHYFCNCFECLYRKYYSLANVSPFFSHLLLHPKSDKHRKMSPTE